jgi:hypothetical protein
LRGGLKQRAPLDRTMGSDTPHLALSLTGHGTQAVDRCDTLPELGPVPPASSTRTLALVSAP